MVFIHYLQVITSEMREGLSKVHENQTSFGCRGQPSFEPSLTLGTDTLVVPSQSIVPTLVCVINRR